MNILINIPDLSKEHGGVYQYSMALLKGLAKGKLNYTFFILCNDPEEDIVEIVNGNLNFHFTNSLAPLYHRYEMVLMNGLNIILRKLKIKKRFLKKDLYDLIISEYNIQIIHTPTQHIIKKPEVKSITTLHDVQELHFPQFFTSAQRAYRAVNFKNAIDRADAVIVSYDHVKNDIINFFSKSGDQVHTVLLDMQDLWCSKIKTRNNSLLDKYDLPINFLLYPASSWEHKNHLNLIKAIKQLNNPEINLICTGHQTDHFTDKILPFIKEQGLVSKIKFLGIVTDEDLYELYHTCRAVVVPTLYEAGSFPLMESILMGIPVICSNVTSLPETIGDVQFVFDPWNINDMANKINKIWSDESYRNDNRCLQKIQAEKIKMNHAAEKLDSIYKALID
jgi:glycosyltransferase involved in cell wall biosynthesis